MSVPATGSAPPGSIAIRLLAVDGNSLAHRGYHSSRQDAEDAGDDDRPLVTGAVVSMLATAWVHGPYDGVVVAFDHAVNRRKLAHPEYKANRPPTPPELTAAIGLLREHLTACGLLVVEDEGTEGDDLIAAAVDACEPLGWACDVLSSDRDLTALVGPTTRLLRPRTKFADLVVEDEHWVRANYRIEPWQYTELAALRGDPSDGLTGATGIGPKIAARLLRDYGSVMGIYEVLHELQPKIEACLREARDRVERNLELMAPIPHLDVEVERALGNVDPDRVSAVLEPLGLGAPARRLARAIRDPLPPLPPLPPPPSDPLGEMPRELAATVVHAGTPTTGEQDALW